MTKTNKKKSIKVTWNLGIRELLGVALCAIIFLIGPIMIFEYLKSNQTSKPGGETYTKQALEQAQSKGRVAGLTTVKDTNGKEYVIIPMLNFRFDTTLSETPSVVLLLGTMLFAGGVVFAITLTVDSSRKMTIKR